MNELDDALAAVGRYFVTSTTVYDGQIHWAGVGSNAPGAVEVCTNYRLARAEADRRNLLGVLDVLDDPRDNGPIRRAIVAMREKLEAGKCT